MNKIPTLVILAIVCAFFVSPMGQASPQFNPGNPSSSGLILSFDDEFNELSASDGGVADGKRWINHRWYRGIEGNASVVPDALSVHNGVLTLQVWNDGAGWKTGVLQTTGSKGGGFSQKFGYFEARLKLPRGPGFNSHFFLINHERVTNDNAPASEIDIVELLGDKPNVLNTTVHRDSARKHAADRTNKDAQSRLPINLSNDFHTYGVLWPPQGDWITFYLDGQAIKSVPKFDTTDSSPMFVSLGVSVGTKWAGSPDATTPNPSGMLVDYVRVWRFP